MTDIKTIAERDHASVLHPATQLKDFASGKLGDPTIVVGGKGIRIEDAQGNSYIDGFAGLYCVNVGYGRTEGVQAGARSGGARRSNVPGDFPRAGSRTGAVFR